MNRKLIAPLIVIVGFFSTTALAQGIPQFEDVDANADGELTKEEVNAFLQGFDFDAADADENDILSRNEYDAAIQQQTQSGG